MSLSGKNPLRDHLPLVVVLAAATVVAVTSSLLSYRNAVNAAEDSLKFQAMGVTASLEASLKHGAMVSAADSRNIFRDVIAGGEWEGIAFIALYDREGVVVLHSNEHLKGRRVQDRLVLDAVAAGRPVYGDVTLGTGEKVFVSNSPVRASGSEGILRIAFHTYPVEKVIRQERIRLTSVSFVVAALWIVGFFLIRARVRAERLKQMMAEKERFAVLGEMSAVLAHEIRNPLGSIKGFAQYLIEQGGGAGENSRGADRESLGVIVSESERLEALMEDLLSFARPDEARSAEFPLSRLIAEAIEAFQRNEEMSGISIKCSPFSDVTMRTDRDKLRQVLENLIRNACDATGGGGNIEIEVATPHAGGVSIAVSDNGCGMSRETLGKAFSPFFTTKAKGTGLGLAIVERLVKALGGKIGLESGPGKGTVARLEVPVNLVK